MMPNSGQRKAFESMERLLGRSQEVRRAVANAAQFLRLPQALVDEADGRPSRVEAFSEMAALVEGLRRLVVGDAPCAPAVAGKRARRDWDDARAAQAPASCRVVRGPVVLMSEE